MTNTDHQDEPSTPPLPHGGKGTPVPVGQYDEPQPEFSILDLLLVLLKHKTMIVAVVACSALAAVVVSFVLPNVYRSTATIMPYTESGTPRGTGLASALGGLGGLTGGLLGFGFDSDLNQLEVLMKSRELTHRVITRYDLLPVLFRGDWNEEKKAWARDTPPTEQDGYRLITDSYLSVSVDPRNGTVRVAFDHNDRQFSRDMVERYLTELSETMRQASIREAREKISFVQEELNSTADALLRDKLYTLLANEIAKETFARAQKHFGFRVIDPPVVPDPNKRVKPRRTRICILTVTAAFFLAVFSAFVIESIQRATEKATPKRREELRKHLPFIKSYQQPR